MKRIVVGSRGSRLAMIQAESVMAKTRTIYPDIEMHLKKVVTTGDRNHHIQLNRIGVAIFVKELEEALLDHNIDIAVHSLKDVPTEIPQGLSLIAVTERLDPRDALIAKSCLRTLAPHSKIGTSSLRRSVQLAHLRSDLVVSGIRGNLDTRLNKVSTGDVDGIVVAVSALLRLDWRSRITEYLPLDHFLPAAGQGVLVIECRDDDREIIDLISPLNHLPTWQSVMAERAFLRALGVGCRAPIAALGTITDSILMLEGMIANMNNNDILRSSVKGSINFPEELGIQLAQKLLSMGATKFITELKDK